MTRNADEDTPRRCALCQREFVPARSHQRFCSAECRDADKRRRGREDMRAKRGSFAPHPCLGCAVILVGRARRCPACARENTKRIQREAARRRWSDPTKAEALKERKRGDRQKHPNKFKSWEHRAYARKKQDPEKVERIRAQARDAYAWRMQHDPAFREKRLAQGRAWREANREKQLLAQRKHKQRQRWKKLQSEIQRLIHE
jgi:hypothetical protein